jgi:hypothetical protein
VNGIFRRMKDLETSNEEQQNAVANALSNFETSLDYVKGPMMDLIRDINVENKGMNKQLDFFSKKVRRLSSAQTGTQYNFGAQSVNTIGNQVVKPSEAPDV